jgi:hypothetical protein
MAWHGMAWLRAFGIFKLLEISSLFKISQLKKVCTDDIIRGGG